MTGYAAVLRRVLISMMVLCIPTTGSAEVEGNCTMCHKFSGFGRIEKTNNNSEETIKRVFYINNDLFEASYHGKVRCKSCHIGVDKIPHTDVEKVNCATDCHIADPSTNRPFSHRRIVADFNKSAHGVEGSRSEVKSDLPVCKDCHTNKPYHASVEERLGAQTFLAVCQECHQSKTWPTRFYEHMIYRSTKRRPSKSVVELCSTCHADAKLMAKHDLDVVVGFSATFHGKAISYGNEEVANCLNCHAPYQLGFSPHRITSRRDKFSPVNPANKLKTCSQSGCHIKAQPQFATGGRVHPSPAKASFLIRDSIDNGGDSLVVETDSLAVETDFQARVVGWIKLFYKVLIIVVVGGLALHRILEIYTFRRETRMGGHRK